MTIGLHFVVGASDQAKEIAYSVAPAFFIFLRS